MADREFIPSNNPTADVESWEVSPCLELPDHEGGSEIEAFDTVAEAEALAGESVEGVFWGVYVRLKPSAIEAGGNPAVHIRDFDNHADAIAFVRMMNGPEGASAVPGCWWIDEDEGGGCLVICEGDENKFGEREEIAVLYRNRPSLVATQPANARLIAAAPALLQSLRGMVERFSCSATSGEAAVADAFAAIERAGFGNKPTRAEKR